MKFSKILNDPKTKESKDLIHQAQEALSEIFIELGTQLANPNLGSGLGGDPILMQLVAPYPHHCDFLYLQWEPLEKIQDEIVRKQDIGYHLTEIEIEKLKEIEVFKKRNRVVLQTAATDGRYYYWNPKFLLSKSKIGRRLLVGHEGLHCSLMHPNRRGHRIPALWNIACDFRVNSLLIQDLAARKDTFGKPIIWNPTETFRKHMGDFVSIQEYSTFLQNPLNPPLKLKEHGPLASIHRMLHPGYIKSCIEEPVLYFADSNLPKHLKQPEAIYDHLYQQIPKCDCGKLFHYKKTPELKELNRKLEELQEENAKTI